MKTVEYNPGAGCEITEWPGVSVIIITRGRNDMAQRAVRTVLACDYPRNKLQVVVQEETDTPSPILGPGVEYHTIPQLDRGFGYNRNRAVAHACHPIIVFTDDDCEVESSWLKHLVRPLVLDPMLSAVGGAVLIPHSGPLGQCESILGLPGGGVYYIHLSRGKYMHWPTFSTCNCAVRGSVLQQAGGFNEALSFGGEDQLLSTTISRHQPVIFNPYARIYHKPRNNLIGIWRWFVRRGIARVAALSHEPDRHKYIRYQLTTSPTIRIVLLLGFCLIMNLHPGKILGMVFLIYYFFTIWRYGWSRKYYPNITTLLLLPFVKILMDMAMDAGILKALLKKIF